MNALPSPPGYRRVGAGAPSNASGSTPGRWRSSTAEKIYYHGCGGNYGGEIRRPDF